MWLPNVAVWSRFLDQSSCLDEISSETCARSTCLKHQRTTGQQQGIRCGDTFSTKLFPKPSGLNRLVAISWSHGPFTRRFIQVVFFYYTERKVDSLGTSVCETAFAKWNWSVESPNAEAATNSRRIQELETPCRPKWIRQHSTIILSWKAESW